MKYQSSRGKYSSIRSAEAIKMGISPDGGLFVPDSVPQLDKNTFARLECLSYQARASKILEYYLTDFTIEEINRCVNSAYSSEKFDNKDIAPLVQLKENVFIQELWHGPTSAFKDMALQILPFLLTTSMSKTNETSEIIILVATSGDTGKAALEGFKDIKGTRIIVFFPEDGVSEIQKRQMVTQEGENVYVAAVKGNFDNAQNGVKNIFTNLEFNEKLGANNMKLSSANSINWGRLLPQIVYYISAYVDLRANGHISDKDAINIVVPTGNFGNILAAYYAGKMGVPINKLICASNSNNVLTDFIRTGIYDANREFKKTCSPSMDILISSNLERLLYEITDHDADRVNLWMERLKTLGRYEIDKTTCKKINSIFRADFCSEDETLDTINNIWETRGYLLDTHTAVAVNVYEKYLLSTNDYTKTIIASTASPFKFGSSVARAILQSKMLQGKNEFEIIKMLSAKTGIDIPVRIKNLDQKEIKHRTVSSPQKMEETILSFLVD